MHCSRHHKYMSLHEFLLLLFVCLFVCLFVLFCTPDQPSNLCSFLAMRTSAPMVLAATRDKAHISYHSSLNLSNSPTVASPSGHPSRSPNSGVTYRSSFQTPQQWRPNSRQWRPLAVILPSGNATVEGRMTARGRHCWEV